MEKQQQKSLYKWVLILAAPMALQNIITFAVGLADNLMVGSLGELALSGVYVSNQLQTLLHMLVMGLGTAMTVLAIQYWGKRDTSSIKILIGIALRFGLAASSIFLLATLFFPERILMLFTDQADVIAESLKYMTIIRFSYIFFCITQILIASMRCVERVKIGMYVSIISFFVNITLNWILIFGNLGAPALGIRGAAIATLITRMLETPIMIYYVRVIDTDLLLRFRDLLKSNVDLLKDYFRYGLPIILGDIQWGLNLVVQGAIIGRLGANALASVSIANVVFSVVGVAMFGTAGATAVIIGQTVGSGDNKRVMEYAKKLQVLFLVIGVISGTALFLTKDYIILLYNISGDTVVMATQFMTVLSVTIIGTAYQMSSLTGIVRAGGATHFVLMNDLIFVWLVVIPSALIAAFVFKAPPYIVFACLKCDQILKCFVAVVKVNRFKWIKNLTRDNLQAVEV